MLEQVKMSRDDILALSAQSREKKRELAKTFITHDNVDVDRWKELAKKYNVRLPQKQLHNSEVKYLKRILAACGIDFKEYLEDCGCKTLKQLVALNTEQSALAECGFLLEWIDERNTA